MEKKKWLWKRRPSDKSPGKSESSGSTSSPSEKNSDDQEAVKASLSKETQSPEVISEAMSSNVYENSAENEDSSENVRSLTERLAAALVNVSAKEELVKQHSKVAEEAIAGWEKAEDEVRVLKQQLGDAVQQKLVLEDRLTHLDGALKECLRQLRLARDEQEQKIHEPVEKATRNWESPKSDFEHEMKPEIRSESPHSNGSIWNDMFEHLKRENAALREELSAQSKELEIRKIEMDLSTQAAEIASKQHLESIKKVAKLESENRRLKAMACKSSLFSDHKSAASSTYVESLTDSQSDNGERLNAVSIDFCKVSRTEPGNDELKCSSESWASALIAELDHFKKEKVANRFLPCSSVEVDLMDDFLEIERIAALPESNAGRHCLASEVADWSIARESFPKTDTETMICQRADMEEKLEKLETIKAELEHKLEKMELQKAELEQKVKTMEVEKAEVEEKLEKLEFQKAELEQKVEKTEVERSELQTALAQSQDRIEVSELQLQEAENKLNDLERELSIANESKQSIEAQLISMEAEAWIRTAKAGSLDPKVQRGRVSLEESPVKCLESEKEIPKTRQEETPHRTACSKDVVETERELSTATGKLAECQKALASLGNQLKLLPSLEDFLIDAADLPAFSATASLLSAAGGEQMKSFNGTVTPVRGSETSRTGGESSCFSMSEDNSPPSSSSSASSAVQSNHVSSEKNKNGFVKFFSRTKSGLKLESQT